MFLQLFYIRNNAVLPALFILYSVQVQHRYLSAAAYPHGISVIRVVAGILDVKRSAALAGQTLDRRYGNLIAAHFQRSHFRCKCSRLRMILSSNQLQCRIGTGFQPVMAYINDQFFPFISRNAQWLPCVQSAKSQMPVFCRRNRRIDGYDISELRRKQSSRILQLPLQHSPFRVVFPAFLILRIQPLLQFIDGSLRHPFFQNGVQVIPI